MDGLENCSVAWCSGDSSCAYVYATFAPLFGIYGRSGPFLRSPREETLDDIAMLRRPQIRGSMIDRIMLNTLTVEGIATNPSQDSMIPGSRRLSFAGGASV